MKYDWSSSGICEAGPLGPSLVELCGSSQYLVFMTILNELVLSNEKISGACKRVKPIENPDNEYDFVVIGGGTAGAVVASRLTENPNYKVLVLEAGPDEPAGTEIPLFMDNLIATPLDWNYTITNEKYTCLSTNGSCVLSAGKMLGGSSSHYGMLYIRGNPTDYDNWAALGNDGWTWDEVKPFYILGENNGEIDRVGRYYHGTDGPLKVERFPYVPTFGKDILTASEQAGYGVSDDLNGEKFTGFAIAQTTNDKGVRVSSASAYLRPARNRENLHISLNSEATRVIIENDEAVGVEYYKNGEVKTVGVSKEVVVSAGTIGSPKILLLSGLGSKEYLESMGIDVIKDIPGIGNNLHDHIAYQTTFTINEPDEYDNDYDIAAEYLAKQTGPLSCNGLAQVMATLKSQTASEEYPDLQLYFYGYSASCAPGNIGALQSKGKRKVYIRAVNLRPRSRGSVTLASKDPLEYPVIHFNYLSDPRDVEGLVEAIELGQALAETPAMKAYNLTLADKPIEACSNYTFRSHEYWTCAIHQDGSPELHEAGSCKMGPASDPMAVVDPQLRVYGLKRLRVADNSIMPQVTSGNTGAPAMMIGERAAKFIKDYWGI